MDTEWLIGECCTAVTERYVGNATFEFPSASLAIDCAWRLLRDGWLVLAHRDHEQLFGRATPVDVFREAAALLAGRPVTAGRIDVQVGDIALEFAGGMRLQVFNDSSGYEGWRIGRADGTSLVAASGGEVSIF